MFICHACGLPTKPREQRTILPVFKTVDGCRQIAREIWLCPRCTQTIYYGSPDPVTVSNRLSVICAEREKNEQEDFRHRELVRIGEENYRRERDKLRNWSRDVKPVLIVTEPVPQSPPVAPRGSYQVPEVQSPTLAEMLKKVRKDHFEKTGKRLEDTKLIKSHNARCVICGASAVGGVTRESGPLCRTHASEI